MPVVTNAELASAVQQVVSRVDAREDQLTAWQAGTPEGGPFADGTYAITNLLGETSYFKSPARLQYEVGLLTTAGTGAVATAEAARDAAEAALASAVVQATNASSSASTASTKASEAQVFRNEAANSEANALAHRNAASASASAAALSEADAEAAAIAAAASAASADADATAAAASAAAAATFDPVNFYTKTQADTLLAAKLATADFSWNNLAGKPTTFTPSAHTHVIADVTGLQTALDGKQAAGSYAAAVHGHSIADVTGLQTALDGKQAAGSYAAASHTHVIADVTGLQAALDGKQPAGSYLTGITGSMVTTALGYTPYNATNPNGYISGITSGMVTTALGYTPYNSSNPAGYITGITSGMVTTALGYTPANKAGDTFSGAITVNSGSHQAVIAADGAIELTRSGGGAYIDFKDVTSEDFDSRIQQSGTGFALTGTVSAGSDFRAPIFYDSGNTSFYVDPTNDSVLNTAYFRNSAGYNVLLGNASYFGYSSAYRTLLLGNQAYTTVCIGVDPIGNPSGSFNGGGSGVEVMFKNGVSFITPNSANNGYHQVVQLSDGNAYFGGIAQATGSLRAPIFYDSNDTGYYLNPNSSSNLYTVTVASQLFVNGDARAPIFYDSNNTGYYVDPNGTSVMSDAVIGGRTMSTAMFYAGFTLDANTMPSNSTGFTYSVNAPYTGPITRASAGGGYDMWFNAPYGGGAALSFRTRNGDAGTFNPWYRLAVYDSNPGAGNLYAAIYYDPANTGYYTRPAGSSYIYELTAANTIYSNGWFRSYGDTGWYSQTYAGGIYMIDTSWVRVYNNKGFLADNIIQSGASVRAPIFYDTDNTGYYTDPAGTSNIWRIGANEYRNGAAVWRSASTPNWISFYFDAAGADKFHFANDGNLWMGLWGDWVSNQWRSNIFYDAADTGYYCDPNGTSYLNTVSLGAQTWRGDITWNTGVNVLVPASAECSFDINSSGVWQVWDLTTGAPMIKCPAGSNVEIGQAGARGLYVHGSIYATGNVTAYSDASVKDNIKPITGALSKIARIGGYTYTRTDLPDKDRVYGGVVAQEIEEVLPEAVFEKEGRKAVDYNATTALLIEAIKELRAEVEALKNT